MERRKQPRQKCNRFVKYSLSSFESRAGSMTNLSKDGAFIKTDEEIPIGKKLKLSIPFTSGSKIHTVDGEVKHSRLCGVGVGFIKKTKKKLFKLF